MKNLRVAIRSAPPAMHKPGERFALNRKFVKARRRMRELGVPHILDGGGRFRVPQLVLPSPQAF